MTDAYTHGPWRVAEGESGIILAPSPSGHPDRYVQVIYFDDDKYHYKSTGDARLIAAAPDMLAALLNVRGLISEGAQAGFNYKDGDWAERLFASQQVTSAAIKKASP